MHAHLETKSREAFELVTDALEFIDRYRQSKDIDVLDSARKKLVSALEKDPSYFRARYYDAIVDDLAGRPSKAVDTLKQLLGEKPPFVDEVRYNLGVAEYHNYGHEALERAIEQFSSIVKDSSDLSLRLRAEAGLAQANAMHMIPKVPDQPDLEQIERHFDATMIASKNVLLALGKHKRRWSSFGKGELPPTIADEIEWTAHNARGMALMYYTDYLPPIEGSHWQSKRIRRLREAIQALDRADSVSPKNWANYCDMASARMRLGYYKNDEEVLDKALALLKEVVDHLRPRYAFAIYETGRILRLRGDFESAARHFEQVLAVPREQRDISDRRPTLELSRARRKDKSFP